MASATLGKFKKDYIKSKLVQEALGDKLDELVTEESAIAQEIYNRTFPEAERKKMNALPRGWLPECRHVVAAVKQSGDSGSISPVHFYFENHKKFTSTKTPDKCVHLVCVEGSPDPLRQRVIEYKNKRDLLKRKEEELCREIDAVFEEINTTKQLNKTWPEVYENFSSSFSDEELEGLVSEEQILKLNKELGLVK